MTISSNLFDGQNGHSDGTALGYSRPFALTGIDDSSALLLQGSKRINVSVSGNFDGANARLEKWLNGAWVPLEDVTWTRSRQLQNLPMDAGTGYRLAVIGSIGSNTNIQANISY